MYLGPASVVLVEHVSAGNFVPMANLERPERCLESRARSYGITLCRWVDTHVLHDQVATLGSVAGRKQLGVLRVQLEQYVYVAVRLMNYCQYHSGHRPTSEKC